ncbi:flagellar filament capping protein FliD [Chromatiaceae bacterium AAb-1]|nr:flagellar filament capping protein FliD [Chromatiaceae bacterium AAb-1]
MSGINFLGSASGLPLEEMVTALVNVEKTTKLTGIDTKASTLNASLSGFGKLKSALSAFQDSLKKLSSSSLSARTATVTQPTENRTYLEATAANSATAGTFDIKVRQLAAGSRIESADLAYSSANDVIATSDGILTFTAGDKSFDIEVTAGMTLNELRNKINDNADNFGVSANIINAGGSTGTKLVLTSDISGEGNDLVISNNNAELDALSTQPTGSTAGLNTVQNAQNAIIEIDGITAASSTNVFDNVIQDVSLTVKAVTPEGNNAKVDVATDKQAAEENIRAFIDSYNALVDQIGELTKPRTLGADGKTVTAEGGALNADSLPRSLMSLMNSVLGGKVGGDTSSNQEAGLSTLHALGITFNKDGKLEILSTSEYGGKSGLERFNAALDENFDAVAEFFGGENGLVNQLDSYIKEFNQTGGILATKEASLQEQIDQNVKARDAANRYLQDYEATLRKKYVALDVLLGGMQNAGSTVLAQLSSLPGFSTNKSS